MGVANVPSQALEASFRGIVDQHIKPSLLDAPRHADGSVGLNLALQVHQARRGMLHSDVENVLIDGLIEGTEGRVLKERAHYALAVGVGTVPDGGQELEP